MAPFKPQIDERLTTDAPRPIYIDARKISSATNDGLAIWTGVQKVTDYDVLLRTAPAREDIAVRQLQHGAAVMQELKQLGIGTLEGRFVQLRECAAYEIVVPKRSLLLTEIIRARGKLEIGAALAIVRSVAEAVGRMHKNGLLHNDISPDAILLLNGDLLQTRIDISLLSLEYTLDAHVAQATLDSPIPSSTVSYAAPENSGRFPYRCSSRADLYSIGILLYQLLAGELPYSGITAIEILHGHIAGTPVSLSSLGIPKGVCDMVKKLLQKNPELRYQSSDSLLVDIDILLLAIGEGTLDTVVTGRIDELSRPRVGTGDFVGRKDELSQLSQSIAKYRKTSKLNNGVIVIKGVSGTGKSCLAERLFSSLSHDAFVRASCKYNQSSSSAPFGSLKTILDDLIRQSMLLPSADLEVLGMQIAEKLAEDAPLLMNLVPELKALLGYRYASVLKSVQAYSISHTSIEARTRAAMVQFLKVFARVVKPLLLYLDDIQWSSSVDLSVILDLLKSTSNVMIVVTYRENELPSSVREAFLEKLTIDTEVRLDSVSSDDVRNLVESSLRRSGSDVDQLIEVVTSRTATNLLFIKQYLQSLFDLEMIYFDWIKRSWQIHLDTIIKTRTPENVLDLVLLRLSTLDQCAQRTLFICACLARPSTSTSRIIKHCHGPKLEVAHNLTSLCSAGFLNRLDDPQELDNSCLIETDHLDQKYLFAHDRIQQACLNTTSPRERADSFLEMGKTSLEDLDIETAPAAEIFVICDLIIDGIKDRPSLDKLVDIRDRHLFVAAARLSNQPEVKLGYLEIARQIQEYLHEVKQGDHAHRELQALLLDTYIAVGEVEKALCLIEELQKHAATTGARIRLLQQKAQAHWMNKNDAEVRAVGQEGLRLAGFDVHFRASAEELMPLISYFMSLIPQTAVAVASYANLPTLTDEVLLASQSLLVTILPAIFFGGTHLTALVLGIGVSTAFVHGISTDGCYLLSFFGLASSDICSPGYDYAKAKALADLALSLSERIREAGSSKQDADILATMYVLQGGVNAWHIDDRDSLSRIFQASGAHTKRAYNSEYIANSMTNAQGFFGLFRGQSLLEIDRHFGPDQWLELVRRGDNTSQAFALPTFQTTEMLLKEPDIQALGTIHGHIVEDEESFAKRLVSMPGMHQANYFRCKLLLALLMNSSVDIERQLLNLFRVTPSIQGVADWAFACIMRAFVLVEADILTGNDQEFLKTFLENLDIWSRDCCQDFAATRLFFIAERASKDADILTTMSAYEEAIQAIRTCGNLLLTGLFAERCHKRIRALLGDTASLGYLRIAEEAFDAWGCISKVNQLRMRYPQAFDVSPPLQGHLKIELEEDRNIRSPQSVRAHSEESLQTLSRPFLHRRSTSDKRHVVPDSSSKNQNISMIDLSTVIEVTSLLNQTTNSQEIITALLLHLIRIAGASIGAVVLMDGHKPSISAIADQAGIKTFSDQPLSDEVEKYKLPSKIILMSLQLECIISDGTLQQKMPRPTGSFLVLPLIHQSVVLGAVYMENQHVSSLFANESGTVNLIAVLVGQVASQLSRNSIIAHLRQNKAELLEAKSQAEFALGVKDRILSTVSHELRTPFNSILGFANLLLDTPLTEQQTQMTESIQTSSQNLLAIVNDILDFSSIEQGTLKLHPAVFNLRKLVNMTLESIQPSVVKKGLDVIHSEESTFEDAYLLGDEGRIRQCLLNLISNAVKFSSHNIVIIRTKLDWLDRETNKVTLTLSVTDKGIGIASEDQSKLFEQFSQIDNSLSRTHEGTGLGLAITKRIVQLFHGQTSVNSKVGQGSTFTLSFELHLDSTKTPRQRAPRDTCRETCTVLILDQYTERAQVMQDHLGTLDIRSYIVLDPAQLGDQEPGFSAIIISDTSNYSRYLDAIRANFAHLSLPIFATVPFTTILQNSVEEPQNKDITAFLPTPLHRRKLHKLLSEHLQLELTADLNMLQITPAEAKSVSVPPQETKTPAMKLRVLTVDDNRVNIAVAKQFLKREGLETDTAYDGFEALAKVRMTAYDVICMDIQMPRCDGVEASKRIRELYKDELNDRAPPYIIALTANAIAGSKERYLGSGMDDYLSKPLNRTSLQNAIARARAAISRLQQCQ